MFGMYKNQFEKSADLFRGLSVLKEEIVDNKTGRVCTVNKVWNTYLDMFGNRRDTNEIWEEIDSRFTLEDYQYNILLNLSKALEICVESGVL